MKIAVINYSGNTGKSTLTKHLLVPQLYEAQRIAIEDLNDGDGRADIDLSSKTFRKFSGQLDVADDDQSFVIDIGSSVVKEIVSQFAGLESTRGDIDFWVLPVTPYPKQLNDTMSTIDALITMGVERGKVIVIPNMVSDVDSFEQDFQRVSSCAEADQFFFCPQAVLENEVYQELKNSDSSVFDIIAKHTKESLKNLRHDFRGDETKMEKLANIFVLRNASDVAARNLREVFAATPIAARLAAERSALAGRARPGRVLRQQAQDTRPGKSAV